MATLLLYTQSWLRSFIGSSLAETVVRVLSGEVQVHDYFMDAWRFSDSIQLKKKKQQQQTLKKTKQKNNKNLTSTFKELL